MGETSIEWADFTFNPWWGCQRVSPGCEHCYAETFDKRVGGGIDPADGVKKLRWGPKAPRLRTSAANWKEPLKWNRKAVAAGVRKRVFCASMADVFEDRPEVAIWRFELFQLIAATPHLDWLLLTKRPENVRRMMPTFQDGSPDGVDGIWPNVWLGTTVEDQQRANVRIPILLSVPAVVHFLSCEPLLEFVGLPIEKGIDWVIVGGESGGGARPFNVKWARSLVRQSRLLGAAPFVKQLGANIWDRNDAGFDGEPGHGWAPPAEPENENCTYQGELVRVRISDSHGGDPAEWPEDLRVREFPEVRR